MKCDECKNFEKKNGSESDAIKWAEGELVRWNGSHPVGDWAEGRKSIAVPMYAAFLGHFRRQQAELDKAKQEIEQQRKDSIRCRESLPFEFSRLGNQTDACSEHCPLHFKCLCFTEAKKTIERLNQYVQHKEAQRQEALDRNAVLRKAMDMERDDNKRLRREIDKLMASRPAPATDEEREKYAKWCEEHANDYGNAGDTNPHYVNLHRIAALLRAGKRHRIEWWYADRMFHAVFADGRYSGHFPSYREVLGAVVHNCKDKLGIDIIEKEVDDASPQT